jgi:hypothetical protein
MVNRIEEINGGMTFFVKSKAIPVTGHGGL